MKGRLNDLANSWAFWQTSAVSPCKILEVFKQHLGLAQILLKDIATVKVAERALQAEPIKGVKNPHDILFVFL